MKMLLPIVYDPKAPLGWQPEHCSQNHSLQVIKYLQISDVAPGNREHKKLKLRLWEQNKLWNGHNAYN